MAKHLITLLLLLLLLLIGCKRNQIILDNEKEGELINNIELEEVGIKIFQLDSCSAPRPIYMHLAEKNSSRELSFLNEYNGSIYQFNYDSCINTGIIKLPRETKKIINPKGYVFISDSIYGILDIGQTKFLTCNINNGKIVSEFDLRGNKKSNWFKLYPQFLPTTSNPLYYSDGKVRLCGQSFFSLASDNIKSFNVETTIDIDNHNITYQIGYPEEIYGNGANWEGGPPTSVYIAYKSDGSKIISYPPSHNVLIIKKDAKEWKYGGSNNAKTITSIHKSIDKTSNKDVVGNYLYQDMYGAIFYDQYRNLIYRYVTFAITESSTKSGPLDKNIGIIVFDAEMNYLGEVCLGNGHNWNINNSFISKEGLNVEYIHNEDEEDCITIKVLNFERL